MSNYKADARESRKVKMSKMGCYGDGGTVLAGDVEPIRPLSSPASNAAKQNQRKNEQRQNPNLSDPANANIKRIYG